MELNAAPIPYLAVACGISDKRLYQLREAGELPAPIGSWFNRCIYDVAEFAEWWNERGHGGQFDHTALKQKAREEYAEARRIAGYAQG